MTTTLRSPKWHAALERTQGSNHWTKRTPSSVARGERAGSAKLTPSDVHAIRQMASTGHTHKSLALTYRVNAATINQIVLRKTWKHLR